MEIVTIQTLSTFPEIQRCAMVKTTTVIPSLMMMIVPLWGSLHGMKTKIATVWVVA